ncbi:MAG: peptide-methionine (S)-S-oxide reductase [Planctomycetes bacterium]|nr:peptide-methionine (S)-S-oxide reductase [Planctomycetota bacterium]
MVRTRVGYAGGKHSDPTYHDLGDHTETTEIDFDPTRITYGQLLDLFWESHNPCAAAWSRQYMSAIFYHGEEQRRLACASRDRVAAARGEQVTTEIAPAGRFTVAEDYHQKYSLRNTLELMREFKRFYPGARDFINSTAAARVNGYLGGHGTRAQLEAELPSLGLSPEAGRLLLARARK